MCIITIGLTYNIMLEQIVCVFVFIGFSQQLRKTVQRSCWGSCRRRGPVKCAWTSLCPLSSSPVVIWWFVVIVLPAYVTAPSAELSSEAASVLSCPKAVVKSHPYTGVAWVALSFPQAPVSVVLERIKSADCLFCQGYQIIFYNKQFKLPSYL